MKKPSLSLLVVLLATTFCASAQDSLYTMDGKGTAVKVLEINKDQVKYKKFSNLEGPAYDIEKADIVRIKYHNGDEDVFQKPAEISVRSSEPAKVTASADELTAKGRKVFIKIEADELPTLAPEVKNELVAWGYWKIVHSEEEADIILQVSTVKKAMTVLQNASTTSKAFVRSRDGALLWESGEFKVFSSMYNGYSSLHGSVKRLVKEGFKRNFK